MPPGCPLCRYPQGGGSLRSLKFPRMGGGGKLKAVPEVSLGFLMGCIAPLACAGSAMHMQ